MSRTYHVMVSRPGGFMNWPGNVYVTENRIRVVAAVLFRRWFGRHPDKLMWHKDGFMAECHDRRGNKISVEQIHNNDPRKQRLS